MVGVSDGPTEAVAVVVAVKESALAISIEITVQALGLPAIVHDPAVGLGELPLQRWSTLIIDHELVRRGAKAFIDRLRAQQWRGLAILLTEDASAAAKLAGTVDHAVVIEKPFLNPELVARLRLAHPEIAASDQQPALCHAGP